MCWWDKGFCCCNEVLLLGGNWRCRVESKLFFRLASCVLPFRWLTWESVVPLNLFLNDCGMDTATGALAFWISSFVVLFWGSRSSDCAPRRPGCILSSCDMDRVVLACRRGLMRRSSTSSLTTRPVENWSWNFESVVIIFALLFAFDMAQVSGVTLAPSKTTMSGDTE